MNKSLSCLSALLAACALHACNADATDTADDNDNPDMQNGSDTGSLGGGNGEDTNAEGAFGSGCDAEETQLDPSATTSLGFTGQSLLDLVVGEHTQTLAWLDGDVEYGPESGRSEMTLSISAAGAPTLVNREPRAARSGSGAEIALGEIGVYCTDSIRVKVDVAVTTPGGALDEVVEGVFEARAGDFASGRLSFDLEALNGSFEATPLVPPNSTLTGSTLTLDLGFTEFGASGAFNLGSTFESNDGQAAGMGASGELAHFPADNYCGPTGASITADQAVRGLSLGQALDALNAMSPAQVRYASGAPSDLTLAFTRAEERVCARFDSSPYGSDSGNDMTLELPGVVRLISTDGRIDGTVALRLSASRENGVQTIRAEGNADAQSAANAPALLSQLGVRDDVDFSAYDGAYVQFLTTAAEDSVGGSLRVYGLDVADCVTNPPPPDPGGMGSPGCRGTDRIPLWGAFWGDGDVTTQ